MSNGLQLTGPPASVDSRLVSIRQFVRYDISGVLDYRASRDAISSIVTACSQTGVTNTLIDTRDAVVNQVSASDVFSLLMHFFSLNPNPALRMAILNDPKDDIDRARIFAEGASARGQQVAAFRDFESAMEWLNEGRL